MRFKIFFTSLVFLILGISLLAYSISSSGFQLSFASGITQFSPAAGTCRITGVNGPSTVSENVPINSITTFTGKVSTSGVCESLIGFPVNYWFILNGAKSVVSSTTAFDAAGDFNFQILSPSVPTSSWQVIDSLCVTTSGCSTTSGSNTLTVTSTNPTTYAQLTFQDANSGANLNGLLISMNAVGGATVCQATTGSSGVVSCTDLTSGNYQWNLVDPNNVYGTPNSGTFLVSPPTPYTATEKISPIASNALQFLDNTTGQAIVGMPVTVSGGCSGTTNIEGAIQCPSLTSGQQYTWTISSSSYGVPSSGSFSVAGAPRTYTFKLEHFTVFGLKGEQSGLPLAGIQITSPGCDVTTNSTGYAICPFVSGNHAVTFTDPHGVYQTYTATITVSPTFNFAVTMRSNSQVLQTIDGTTHSPVSGISISVTSTSGAVACSGTTNSTGQIQCNSIPIQAYQISTTDRQNRYMPSTLTWNASASLVIGLTPVNGGGGGGFNGAQIIQAFGLILVIMGGLGTVAGALIPSGRKLR